MIDRQLCDKMESGYCVGADAASADKPPAVPTMKNRSVQHQVQLTETTQSVHSYSKSQSTTNASHLIISTCS